MRPPSHLSPPPGPPPPPPHTCAAVGVKLPKVNSLQWEFFILVQRSLALLQSIRDKIFGKK